MRGHRKLDGRSGLCRRRRRAGRDCACDAHGGGGGRSAALGRRCPRGCGVEEAWQCGGGQQAGAGLAGVTDAGVVAGIEGQGGQGMRWNVLKRKLA